MYGIDSQYRNRSVFTLGASRDAKVPAEARNTTTVLLVFTPYNLAVNGLKHFKENINYLYLKLP